MDQDISQLRQALETQRLSVVELANELLERIARIDPGVNAYVYLDRDDLLAQAQELDRELAGGRARGPLHGVPIGIKDLIDVRRQPTRAGSSFFRRDPAQDAPIVARLRAAGALITGKLNTHEFAWGITTDNPHFGRTANPWDRTRIPGGSSGGSGAAIAAGLAVAAMGSDTLGSVRIPSAYCGLSGIRPSLGSVPMDGIFPLSPSMDVAGPLARSVADAALILAVMRGAKVRAPAASASQVRIARLRGTPWDDVEPEVTAAADAAINVLREQGVKVSELQWSCSQQLADATTTQQRGEAAAIHAPLFAAHAAGYGTDVRGRVEAALALAPEALAAARPVIARERAAFLDALHDVDAVIVPCLPFEAPLAGSETVHVRGQSMDMRAAVLPFMIPASAFGFPALALPCGFSAAGLPLSAQLFTRPESEHMMIAAGIAIQSASDWHLRRATTLPA